MVMTKRVSKILISNFFFFFGIYIMRPSWKLGPPLNEIHLCFPHTVISEPHGLEFLVCGILPSSLDIGIRCV